jgi:lipid II isoglutaminyl synthase (glutamine-hydrolysing)
MPGVPLFAAKAVAARTLGSLSRRTGRGGGTTLPGKALLRLAPDAIERLAAGLPDGVALVSATNGKTTTAALAAALLEPDIRICRNASGANLTSGIASALLGRPAGARLGLFEVDEFALPEIAARTRPRALLLANLFRDQLDRYGELESIAARWREMIDRLPATTTLVLCADDPLIAAFGEGREHVVYVGLDDPAAALDRLPDAADSITCRRCGAALVYDAVYLGHLGAWRCDACGNSRPPLDVAVTAIQADGLDGMSLSLGGSRATLSLPGIYNAYNAVGAFALARVLGVAADAAIERLAVFRAAFGRFERVRSADREAVLLLVKNPAGANEALRTLAPHLDGGVLMLALNDRIADGRDVSWIWDVDFDGVLHGARRIVCCGTRAADMAVRVKYADVPAERLEVVPDVAAAFDRALELAGPGGTAYVLPTYTAMLELQAVASARGLVRPYWEADPR